MAGWTSGWLAWFGSATTHWRDWDAADLAARKGHASDQRECCRPATSRPPSGRSSRASGATSSRASRSSTKLVVIDSDSSDDTARIAAGAGCGRARRGRHQARPGPAPWQGRGDLEVPVRHVGRPARLRRRRPDRVGHALRVGAAGPAADPTRGWRTSRASTTACSRGSDSAAPQGGRVTELVARPLINLHRPELAAVVQPLAGGVGGTAQCPRGAPPFRWGYGVEIALLLDVLATAGAGRDRAGRSRRAGHTSTRPCTISG